MGIVSGREKYKRKNMKKVSFILTTYNCIKTLKTTIDSILIQEYSEIEIVIADGGSTDGTLDLIKQYKNRLVSCGRNDRLIWKSEPDRGIYDAMNKGYHMCSGDIVVFFNDCLAHPHVVEHMVGAIESGGEFCVGAHADLVYVNDGKIVRFWHMGIGSFREGWMPGHPTLYLKREVYEKCGLYDTSYKCSADYEFMLRCLYGQEARLVYVPEVIVKMYYGGTSTQGLKSYMLSLWEGHQGLKKNGIKGAFIIDIRRTLKVLRQFKTKKS